MDGTAKSFQHLADPIEDIRGARSVCAKGVGRTHLLFEGERFRLINRFDPMHDVLIIGRRDITGRSKFFARLSDSGDGPVLSLSGGGAVLFRGISASNLTNAQIRFDLGSPGFLEGTRIATERGNVPIEDLRPDDIIWTRGRGWQALRHVLRYKLDLPDRDDPRKPILVPCGALGDNYPREDLALAPRTRVPCRIDGNGAEVLCPVDQLVGMKGIRPMRGRMQATFYAPLLERHCLLQAAGSWAESLLPLPRHAIGQDKTALQELQAASNMRPLPALADTGFGTRALRPA